MPSDFEALDSSTQNELDAANRIAATLNPNPWGELLELSRSFNALVANPLQELLTLQRQVAGQLYEPMREVFAAQIALGERLRHPLQEVLAAQHLAGQFLYQPLQEAIAIARAIAGHQPLREFLASSTSFLAQLQTPLLQLHEAIQPAVSSIPVDELLGVLDAYVSKLEHRPSGQPIGSPGPSPQTEELVRATRELTEELVRHPARIRETVADFSKSSDQAWASQVIIAVLIMLLGSVVNPVVEHLLKPLLPETRRERIQGTDQLLKERSDALDLSKLRIVAMDNVPVRTNRGKRGLVVARIQAGEPVMFLRKQGRYCLVAFLDPSNGRTNFGWMRSKHLKRLSSKRTK